MTPDEIQKYLTISALVITVGGALIKYAKKHLTEDIARELTGIRIALHGDEFNHGLMQRVSELESYNRHRSNGK